MHLILCDEIDSGKSSFVFPLICRLAGEGVRISGWVTPAFMERGKKRGHDFVALRSGRAEPPIPFTRLHPFENSIRFPDLLAGRRTCPFHFNAAAFDRAIRLTDCIAPVTSHGSRVTDLFVMDEAGPLELALHRGFYKAMLRAYEACPSTLTVVRKGLHESIFLAAPNLDFTVHPLSEAKVVERALRGLPSKL